MLGNLSEGYEMTLSIVATMRRTFGKPNGLRGLIFCYSSEYVKASRNGGLFYCLKERRL